MHTQGIFFILQIEMAFVCFTTGKHNKDKVKEPVSGGVQGFEKNGKENKNLLSRRCVRNEKSHQTTYAAEGECKVDTHSAGTW